MNDCNVGMDQSVDTITHSPSAPDGGDLLSRRVVRALWLCPLQFLFHLLATIVLCMVSIGFTSQYMFIFDKENLPLASPTMSLFRYGNAMHAYWYLLIVALFVVDGPLLFGLQLLPKRHRWISQLYFHSLVLLVLLGIGWITFVLTSEFSSSM